MRNAFEEGQKRGYCGSTELEIVAPKRSWRDIFCRKPQQMKNSLNFANTCLKIIDTRRGAKTVDGGKVTVEWQWKSQAFTEIVTIKEFSVDSGQQKIKDFDLFCK